MNPTFKDLTTEVAAALRGAATAFRFPRVVAHAYEAYCFSLLFSALREVGFTPIARQLRGSTFVFPRGPRHILDPNSSYYVFLRSRSRGATKLELHGNTYALGTSGHPHE